jgi:hypothetical protein
MKRVMSFFMAAIIYHTAAGQNVGIGTISPVARLHVADSNVLFTGLVSLPLEPGNPPIQGAGIRLMWYADKAAFRVGRVGNFNWDKDSIGQYSVAMGFNTKASNTASTAMGENTTASGYSSTAMGAESKAFGSRSTAMGYLTNASGINSTAMGQLTIASGTNSTAMGYFTTASGFNSIAMGVSTKAKNDNSLVIGQNNDTTQNNTLFEIGNGSTGNNRKNAMIVFLNGNTDHNGFTRLGESSNAAPRIKIKKLTGISSATQNTWVNIPHGLTRDKIVGVSIVMKLPAYVDLPPSYTYNAGYEYHYQITNNDIVVINANGNSGNILSKNFTIVITYEE